MAVIPTVLARTANEPVIREMRARKVAGGASSANSESAAGYSITSAMDIGGASDHELLVASTGSDRADGRGQAVAISDRAFAELYRRHKAEIYTYCLRMVSRDRDLASDLFQEVFIRAYERAGQFRTGSNVRGWLFTIARNLCLNALRDRKPEDSIEKFPSLENRDRSLAPEYDE